MNHCHVHQRRTQQVAHPLEAVVAQPRQVVEHRVDGVHALATSGMSAAAMCLHVDHHQSFLCHGGLHARWLAHNGQVDVGQLWNHAADAVGTRHLFLGRGQIDEVVGLACVFKEPEHLEQGHQSASAVVAAQTIEAVALHHRRERVAGPRCHGSDGVDMGIEQKSGALGVDVASYRPEVVAAALGIQFPSSHGVLQDVGGRFLVAAH